MDCRPIGAVSDRGFETAQGDAPQRSGFCCVRVTTSRAKEPCENSSIAAPENAAGNGNGVSRGVFSPDDFTSGRKQNVSKICHG
jgi:hypothetical protein